MITRIAVALSFVIVAACGGDKSTTASTTPESSTPPAAEPATPAMLTPEECSAQGGQVRGDIGDGKIACAAGERDLGRVKTGIEGGVCCAPGSPASP